MVVTVVKKNDFSQLTEVVCDHLTSIQDALRAYQNTDAAEGGSVSEEMQTLLARVRAIESEADRTRDLLATERHKSNHDELTGLPNRAGYNERSFHELRRFKRYHRPLTLAVCDIDHFKRINDNFGHQAGDKSLVILAKYIAQKIREVDFVARLGGEEFVLILPETTEKQAFRVLDKVRASVASLPFKFHGKPVQITVSFGLSQFIVDDTMETAFERADKALYAAKTGGRNQVRIESVAANKKDVKHLAQVRDSSHPPMLSASMISKF